MEAINVKKEIRSAIKKGNLDKVKELIDGKKEILNMSTAFGTWLHVASTHGKLDIVKYLVHEGIDIEVQGGGSDCAAIKSAASEGNLDIVKFLFENDAKLDVSDSTKNPLFGAIYGGHKDVVEYLVDIGIDITVKYSGEYKTNMSAYSFADEMGQVEIANYLKEKLEK